MTKTLAASVLAILLIVGTATADANHKSGQQHRNAVYQQGSAKTGKETASAEKTSVNAVRLPGRDCKFYEGGTRQHRFPQYEIGNPNRPECAPLKG